MCKPVTVVGKNQILQRLSCPSNGNGRTEMDFSLSSDFLSDTDSKTEVNSFVIDNVHFKQENEFQIECSKWNGSRGEDETSPSFQRAEAESFQNNKLFREDEDISAVDNIATLGDGSLEENLISSMRPDSKTIVDNLIEKINQLSIIQKMLLYLKLPSPSEDPDQLDPLRRPLNPLGNRQEVSQALAYIRTHFQPDPDVSLPKKEIYNEYVSYCSGQKIKPLSTADFGKAMKQVYPVVRPRRLGERGNSRYCYSGLCNRNELEKPRTPSSAQAQDAVSRKICVWASKVLNVKVDNLTELSNIISSEPQSANTDCSDDSNGGRFLTEGAMILEEKEKKKIELEIAHSEEPRSSKQRKRSNQHVTGQRTDSSKSSKLSAGVLSAQSLQGEIKANDITGPSNVCDNINQKQIDVGMLKIKNVVVNSLDLKPEKSTNLGKKKKNSNSKKALVRKAQRVKKKNVPILSINYKSNISLKKESQGSLPIENGFAIASIEEEPSLESQYNVDISKDYPSDPLNFSRGRVVVDSERNVCGDMNKVKIFTETFKTRDCDQRDNYNDIGYLTSENLGHYLQDEGNSQEPEEELLKYFKDPIKSEQNVYNLKDTSQLRLLLEQNEPEETSTKYEQKISERDTGFNEEDVKPKEIDSKHYLISPQEGLQQSPLKSSFLPTLHNSSTKRRVSFENIPDSFPQSPITCSKNFSFTPISPRPPTVSKSLVNISPFVFPRETVFRGKLSITNSGNHQTPIPSPVTRAHVSPYKGSSRSTSLSSTPSPITNGRSSSSVLRGRSTPQDVIEHVDSLKSSPIISPSSSSGVFLSPASPMSSCNSPVFIFRKNMSPVKQGDDSKSSTKSNSLLQALLLTGKCSETKPSNLDNRSNAHFESVRKDIQPLGIEVPFHFSSEQNLSSYRSQSVPTLTNNIVVSPSSNTLPFPDSVFGDKETPALLEIKPNDLDVLDTVFKNSEENLIMENMSDNDTLESGIHTVGNDVSMESVISNLCDFLNDKGLSGTNEHIKVTQVSRSQPNTPIPSDSSRDPVVSAFAISSASKSYPSTPTVPTHSFNGITANINFSTKRNINPLLDSLSNTVSSLSDDIDLNLNNFADLSACDDAFNQLAKEVASSNTDKELQ